MKPIAVTVPEACALIGVKRTTMFRLLAEKKIHGFCIGRRRLVTVESLEALIAAEL